MNMRARGDYTLAGLRRVGGRLDHEMVPSETEEDWFLVLLVELMMRSCCLSEDLAVCRIFEDCSPPPLMLTESPVSHFFVDPSGLDALDCCTNVM